jgi:hypothetical protein
MAPTQERDIPHGCCAYLKVQSRTPRALARGAEPPGAWRRQGRFQADPSGGNASPEVDFDIWV